MSLKSTLRYLVLIIFNLCIIILLWNIGWKAILGFCVGVFVGACVVLYWEYSKNTWLSYILKDVMTPPEKKKGKK